ncbi:MAG: hypothetical protein SFU98_20095 [Leptospiraceae bacterium]|nr:hypothetical protein [Leptospiraceae bacterium]
MSHQTHENHSHKHGINCGHLAIQHGNHIDYLHDGHLHHEHEGHYDECLIEVTNVNPDNCTTGHTCTSHSKDHVHGPSCGHPAIPHGDHIDYLVDGHLHHQHNGHCDNHGEIKLAA